VPLTGYGGDYCQGRLQSVQISNGAPFDSGSVSLPPGRWTYYYITINTASLTVGSNTLTVAWSVSQPVLSNLYFIFSPVYSNSYGQLYFMPASSWVLNSSAVIPVGKMSLKRLTIYILIQITADLIKLSLCI